MKGTKVMAGMKHWIVLQSEMKRKGKKCHCRFSVVPENDTNKRAYKNVISSITAQTVVILQGTNLKLLAILGIGGGGGWSKSFEQRGSSTSCRRRKKASLVLVLTFKREMTSSQTAFHSGLLIPLILNSITTLRAFLPWHSLDQNCIQIITSKLSISLWTMENLPHNSH